jgi:dTMP kinase
MFITLEGPEGAGKSTQLPWLCEWLESIGKLVVCTRNPGGTSIGTQIRAVLLNPLNTALVPLAELLLYAADRAQHVEEIVKPALEAGFVVLCDRFSDSTLAYQGYGRGLDLTLLHSLNGIATAEIKPDLTLLLDLDPAAGLKRIALTREGDRLEHEALAFHQRLRAGYLELARQEPARFAIIDASQSQEDVQKAIRQAVEPRLGRVAE